MKNILFIGVGGTGRDTIKLLYQKIRKLGNQTDNDISALIFDTTLENISKPDEAKLISLSDNSEISTVCDRIGREHLREWFPCDDINIRRQSLAQPDSTWRKRAYLAFINAMYKKDCREIFHRELEKMVANSEPGSTHEIYIISSAAGGTGCGAFIPIALYAKQYIKRMLNKDPVVSAVIACPDIYNDGRNEDYIHRYANAYATLKEINALNLVSRGYNNPARRKGMFTPIDIKIGDKDEPVLGLLFDSRDKRFWIPDAAPFDKIYVLDKIPGVSSVYDHITVIADSLYSLICTSIGASMDSEMSAHLLATAQSNGGNAIFASISTAQIRFPIDTILEYLASKKTLETCNEEWLRLYQLTEAEIEEDKKKLGDFNSKERIVKEKSKKYANFLMTVVERELKSSASGLGSILNRCTYSSPKSDEYPGKGLIDEYLERVCQSVVSSVSADKVIRDINKIVAEAKFNEADEVINKKDFENHAKRVFALHDKLLDRLRNHYSQYAKQQLIRNRASKIADAMLPVDRINDPVGNKEYSIVYNLLTFTHNGGTKYCHPVAAIVRLSGLRQAINDYLAANFDKDEFGKDYRIGYLSNKEEKDRSLIPKVLFDCTNNTRFAALVKQSKSRYCLVGREKSEDDEIKVKGKKDAARLYYFKTDDSRALYKEKRSTYYSDVNIMKDDAVKTAEKINEYIQNQLLFGTLKNVLDRLDSLIEKYRDFFRRFVEESVHAHQANKDLLEKDSDKEKTGSIVNIYSSPEKKREIEQLVLSSESAGDNDRIIRSDSMSGKLVFGVVFGEFQMEFDEGSTNLGDSTGIKNLFNRMNEENKKIIEANPEFRRLRTSNLLMIIEKLCESNTEILSDEVDISKMTVEQKKEADARREAAKKREYIKIRKELIKQFAKVKDLATPSLQIEESPNKNRNEIMPVDVLRVLMSKKTARYISQKPEVYDISVTEDRNDDIKYSACAEEFVKKYIHATARVSVVDNIPDGIIYITGEKMDISPVRISKFNEQSALSYYYKSYRKVLAEAKQNKNDLLNPHIGFNLYKRGFLPCINPLEEEKCNEKLIKALLYAFMSGKIIGYKLNKYENAFYIKRCKYIDNDHDFKDAKIHPDNKNWVSLMYEGEEVTDKNLPWLMAFLRNQDNMVEEWSKNFDAQIELQLKDLPGVISKESANVLTSKLNEKPFITMLCQNLYLAHPPEDNEEENKSGKSQKSKSSGDAITDSLLGFAFRLKIGEELSIDFNDAERILRIAYKCFFDIFLRCYPLKFFPDLLAEAYSDVIEKVRAFFLESTKMRGIEVDTRNRIVSWLNELDVFKAINIGEMFDQDDDIVYVDWEKEEIGGNARTKSGGKAKTEASDGSDGDTEDVSDKTD